MYRIWPDETKPLKWLATQNDWRNQEMWNRPPYYLWRKKVNDQDRISPSENPTEI